MVGSFIFVGKADLGSSFSKMLSEAGFAQARGIADADAVFVYCESQTELEDAFFDSEGLVQAARKGSYLVDMSPSTPSFARELSAVATVNELHAVEAPLIVYELAAEDTFSTPADLGCFIAGEQDDIDAVSPLLSVLVGNLCHTGVTGTAQMARAAYTIQLTAQMVAGMEADALYRAFSGSGEAAAALIENQKLATGQTVRLLEAVQSQRYTGAYTVHMWMAELAAALMAADDVDLILPGAEACMHLLELLAVIGGSEMPPAALSLVYGEESQCSEHGLDWARAEQAYGEDAHDHYDEGDFEDPGDEFPRGFGSYSSN